MSSETHKVDHFDPRTLSTSVYKSLHELRQHYEELLSNGQINKAQRDKHLKEQKNQAVELYTYLATWGLLRLCAEEVAMNDWDKDKKPTRKQQALKNQEGKREVIEEYFQCLEKISHTKNLVGRTGLETLRSKSTEEYLGLCGLGLAIAQEFSFWAAAVYPDIKGAD